MFAFVLVREEENNREPENQNFCDSRCVLFLDRLNGTSKTKNPVLSPQHDMAEKEKILSISGQSNCVIYVTRIV